ncbi:MAG: carboxypeptidase regulatory-like domain-containing protein [Elusimicrobia bacterium]|nr:carboxypeptidase regulatory-like domain-containing protein [Elusimicrobiota bacterium]
MSRWLKKVMVSILLATAFILGGVVLSLAANVLGTMTYSGSQTGTVIIGAWTDATFTGMPAFSTATVVSASINYSLGPLSSGQYYIKAFIDGNSNFQADNNEASGYYGNPPIGVSLSTSDQTGVNFTINAPIGGGGTTIAGMVNYTGTASYTGKTLKVFAYTDQNNLSGSGVGTQDISLGVFPVSYSLNLASVPGSAYVNAYVDMDSNGSMTQGTDLIGTAATVTTFPGSGISITLSDSGSGGTQTQGKPFTIKLAVGTSLTSAIGGATVEIWDTMGDWMPENDTLLGSTTTAANYSSETGYNNMGQQTTMKYNAVINSSVASALADPVYRNWDGAVGSTGQARFMIAVKKAGYQKVARDINLNQYSNSIQYTSYFWGGWDSATGSWSNGDFVNLPLLPTVTISNRHIFAGGTAYTAEQIIAGTIPSIKPGSNNQNQNGAEIAFKYAISGTTNEWEMGGVAKICIDTNGSGTYDPFDYSKFFWDTNGGPYYSTKTEWNWNYFNNLSTADRKQYKLTQQEFDVMRASKDWSMDQWISGYEAKTYGSVIIKARWEGRDNSWNIVPAGTYMVQVKVYNPQFDQNDDTANLAYGPNTDLKIKVAGSSIAGTIKDDAGNPIPNIRVNAGSMQSWGSAFTKADGTYVISGLVAGKYHLNTESGTSGFPNQDRMEEVAVGDDSQITGINFTLERGGSITGTITIPAPGFVKYKNPWSWTNDPNDPGYYITNGNININAWSPGSPQHGWTNVFVEDDGDATVGQVVNYTLNLPPGTYNLSAQMEGYASNMETAVPVTKAVATAKNLTMAKAGTISGTVTIPVARSEEVFVDVSAEGVDGKGFGWGGTMIPAGATSVPYSIRSLAAGTYDIRFNCWGKYKPGKIKAVAVTAAADITGKDYTFDAGKSLAGKIIINASTLNVITQSPDMMGSGGDTGSGSKVAKKYENFNPLTQFTLWINAWSPSTGYGTGTNVTITRSAAAQEVAYEITGLEDGVAYNLDTWLFGFELKNRPIVYSAPNTTANISLEAFAGSISGKVSGTNADLTKIRVIAREPWWDSWRTPKVAAPAADGTYKLDGLGTGEYIVTCNEYSVAPSTANPMGRPSGKFGMTTERVPMANGEALTGVDFALSAGATIHGKVTLSSTNPPLKTDGTPYTLNDLGKKTIEAFPVKMQWMGWQTAYRAVISTTTVLGEAVYRLEGLGDDIYSVVPQKYGWVQTQAAFNYGQQQPDVATQNVIIAVKSGDAKTQNFEVSNGYNITGTIQRPSTNGVAGDGEDHFWVSLNSAAGDQNQLGGTSVDFIDTTNWQWLPQSERANNTTKRSLSFTLKHVPNGSYVLRVFPWKFAYKEQSKETVIASADLNIGTLNMEQGATIKGKVVDAETGMAVTDDNGVIIHCEARPWIEGSWRNSNQMFEEDMQNSTTVKVATATDTTKFWEKQAGQKTGVFRIKNLPAGNYVLNIISSDKDKGQGFSSTSSNKTYINQTIAGLVVPDSTDEVDIGTIKLKGGVTISGNITDTAGNKLANVLVAAIPSGGRQQVAPTITKTDKEGKFILAGINPLIGFWDVTAASRPRDAWREGIKAKYGEQTKIAIAPLASDINFVLEGATANLGGQVLAASGKELALPWPGETMPVAMVLIQNQSQTYADPMGGIEDITTPDGRFTVYGLVPTGLNPNGTKKNLYSLKVFSKGTATYIKKDIELNSGPNSAGNLQLASGAAVGGTIKDIAGKNLASSLFELPLVSTPDFSNMAFGTFTTNSATNEIERYDIDGLTPATTYYVVLAASEGADIYVDTTSITAAAATKLPDKNITWINKPPYFMVAAVKNDTGIFLFGLWATESVTEAAAADVVRITTNPATGLQPNVIAKGKLAQLELALNKQEVTGVFTPDASDQVFSLRAQGHDVTGLAGGGTYTFSTAVDAYNVQIINPLMGGTVSASTSDPTKLVIPPGSVSDPNDPTGNIDAEVSKAVDATAVVITSAQSMFVRSNGKNIAFSSYPKNFQKALKTTNIVNAQGEVIGRVSTNDKVSSYYDFKIGSAQVQSGKKVKVSLAYDSTKVTDPSMIDIYYLSDNGFIKESNGRTVDTTNKTISAEVNHTSLFAVFKSLGGANAPSGIPDSYKVYPYPNPFKKKTATSELTIKVGIPAGSSRDVKIKIFNIVGEMVREISLANQAAGWHDIIWDCKNDSGEMIASGVYIAQVEAGGEEKIIKIAVLK